MELIYYCDHDKRYAHIRPADRWKYPDAIQIGHLFAPIKRVKEWKDITTQDVREAGGVPACLLAKDVPYTEGLIH